MASGILRQACVGVLAREVAVSQPTVTDSLRALLRKNLVVQARSATDHRRHVVRLTPLGAEVVAAVERADEAMHAAPSMVPADQEATLAVLLGIIARFVEAGVSEVERMCLSCQHLAPEQLRADCPERVSAHA